mgnify:CR=1 FL=1
MASNIKPKAPPTGVEMEYGMKIIKAKGWMASNDIKDAKRGQDRHHIVSCFCVTKCQYGKCRGCRQVTVNITQKDTDK